MKIAASQVDEKETHPKSPIGSWLAASTVTGRHGLRRGLSAGVFTLLAALVGLVFLAASAVAAPITIPELTDALEYHTSGHLREAIEGYTQVLKQHPRSAEAYNWRGMAYDDLGEHEKAIADFSQAVSIVPNYADAFNNRGEAYRKSNKYPEAIRDYRKAVQLDKNFAEAFYNLGLALELYEKKPGEAAQQYEQYLKLLPNAPDKDAVEKKVQTLKAAAPTAPPTPPGAPQPPAAKPGAPAQPTPGAPPKPAAPPGPPPAPGAKPDQTKTFQPGVPQAPGAPGKPGLPTPPVPGLPGGIPTSPEEVQNFLTNIVLPLIMGSLIFIVGGLVIYVLIVSVPYFLIANKTGTPGSWMAFVPILDEFLRARIADKGTFMGILLALGDLPTLVLLGVGIGVLTAIFPPLGLLFLLLPILWLISIIVWIPVCMGIARARGKAASLGLLICLPTILVSLLNVLLSAVMPELMQDLGLVFTGLSGLATLLYIAVPYYIALSR